MPLTIQSDFTPTGDQPRAIAQLTEWVTNGSPHMTLLGVTGSGKSFTFANVIERTGKPALVISPNKTLAAQLYSELKHFFPTAAVHYFVSYYDYYQPEAYKPQTDTYIEKEAMINEEIDRLRHASTQSLLTRDDVIVVASVSCIYGLGSPEEYERSRITVHVGDRYALRTLLTQLVGLQFERNDTDLSRGTFRVRGDTVEIYPVASDKDWVRIELDGDRVERIAVRNISGTVDALTSIDVFSATHYVAPHRDATAIHVAIRDELEARLRTLRADDRLVEAQRLEQRVRYDLEMLEETGYVHGIENYSRYFDGRASGQPPFTLIDFFNHAYGGTRRDSSWLCFIDESHITIPQVRGMYAGDRSRKQTLIDYGFRLPSAADNRPLRFEEFTARIPQTVYVSATPDEYELTQSRKQRERLVAEQLIRPTGLLDPVIDIRPTEHQVQNLIAEITAQIAKKQRTLV
ncbi:MAG: DEAD/DEAH box helicase family protein, partial [bacterium]|nr:DEAD/DEAH box helicase family protein [bacterium]